MQPDYPAQTPGSINPDYSFLNQSPAKRLNLPFKSNSLLRKIIVGVIGLVALIIIISILKGLLSTSPFNKSDYLTVLERQQEIYHILTVDVTSTSISQLSNGDQDFAATAGATLTTALSKTLTLAASYGDKISTANLAKVYSSSIDNGFTSALSANNFDGYFHTVMQFQLSSYEQNLSSAYNSTTVSAGRTLLRAEYAEAELLSKALNSPAS